MRLIFRKVSEWLNRNNLVKDLYVCLVFKALQYILVFAFTAQHYTVNTEGNMLYYSLFKWF